MSERPQSELVYLPLYRAGCETSSPQPEEMPFPRELAGSATGAYLLPGPLPGSRRYVLVDYRRAARLDEAVLFFHHPEQKYLVLSRAELPYYLRRADPDFEQRHHADLEDMHLGVVVAVCQGFSGDEG